MEVNKLYQHLQSQSKQPEILNTATSKQLLKMANFCIERSEAIKKKIADHNKKTTATEKQPETSEMDRTMAMLAQLDALKPFSEEIDGGGSASGEVPVSEEDDDPHKVNQSPLDRSTTSSNASAFTQEEIRVNICLHEIL